MEPYAVIETSGTQYLVHVGDTLQVDRVQVDEGAEITLDRVLAVSDGENLTVGAPQIKDATVNVDVLAHRRGSKVVSFKKKRRKGYSRKVGHRQELTVLKVTGIATA